MRLRLLYNPASGRGRGARAIVGIRAAFARCGFTDVRATTHAGDEARLVSEAIDDGVEPPVVDRRARGDMERAAEPGAVGEDGEEVVPRRLAIHADRQSAVGEDSL